MLAEPAGSTTPAASVEVRWIDEPDAVDRPGEDRLLGRPAAAWRREGRVAAGLPVDRPLVVSGHQAGPWHPGILAKHAVLRAAAAGGAVVADLLVEHDPADPLVLEAPVADAAGGLHVRRLRWGPAREGAAMRRAPVIPRPPGPAGLAGLAVDAADRLEAWTSALDAARRGARHLAGQVRAALADVLPPAVAPPRAWTGSTALLGLPLGRALVEAMVRDPWACADAYARAVRPTPGAAIDPLHVRDDFVELPLWRIDPDGRRRRADDVDAAAWLEGGPGAPVLAPRALLLTAIARLGLADVFVHGRGGATYDAMMRDWVGRWLGVRPAPAVLASADLRLELGVGRATRAAASRRRRRAWAAHHAWHDPEPPPPPGGGRTALERASGPGPVKRELLEAIDALPRGSAARRRAFRRMHAQLEALRGIHVGRVEAAQRRAADARRAAASLAVAQRRDWFAMLHPPAALERLADAIARTPVARSLASEAASAATGRGSRNPRPAAGLSAAGESAPRP